MKTAPVGRAALSPPQMERDVSYNGCETIAVHNVKVIKGMDSTLSGTLKTFSECGAMMLNGYWGYNPYKIGKVLDSYGISYSRTSVNGMFAEGTYIVSYMNDDFFKYGIHTIAVTYDGQSYTGYNYTKDGSAPFNPSDYIWSAICVYYVG